MYKELKINKLNYIHKNKAKQYLLTNQEKKIDKNSTK